MFVCLKRQKKKIVREEINKTWNEGRRPGGQTWRRYSFSRDSTRQQLTTNKQFQIYLKMMMKFWDDVWGLLLSVAPRLFLSEPVHPYYITAAWCVCVFVCVHTAALQGFINIDRFKRIDRHFDRLARHARACHLHTPTHIHTDIYTLGYTLCVSVKLIVCRHESCCCFKLKCTFIYLVFSYCFMYYNIVIIVLSVLLQTQQRLTGAQFRVQGF